MSNKALNVILLLLVIQNICDAANDLSEYHDAYYDRKTNKSPQVVSGTTSGNIISFKGVSCSCQNLGCSCCTGIRLKKFHFDEEACAQIAYQPQNNAVHAALALNNKEILSTSFPVKTPPPLCASVPHLPSVKICLKFQALSVVNNKLNICADVETHISSAPTLKLHFNCIKV